MIYYKKEDAIKNELDWLRKDVPKITNAEKIRSMTDEELAGLLFDRSSIFSCSECSSEYGNTNMACGETSCYRFIMDWLKSEVEE